jgi:hypothetical protein
MTSNYRAPLPGSIRQGVTRPPQSEPVTIRHASSNSNKVSTNVEAEEGLVAEFMSAIFTDENCENYLAEFAGMDFYPDSNENR